MGGGGALLGLRYPYTRIESGPLTKIPDQLNKSIRLLMA